MSREEVLEAPDTHRSRLFVLLKEYQIDPKTFRITYERKILRRIPLEEETAIKRGLLQEKALIDDPEIPISGYN